MTTPLTNAGTQTPDRAQASITRAAWFFAITFALSWIWAWPLALADATVTKGDGWPTHMPALLGPALAAILLTTFYKGRTGLRDLIARMVRWRFPGRWWAVTLSPLAFLAVALMIQAVVGGFAGWESFSRYSGLPDVGVLAVFGLALLLNGFGEETGWRGFAVPALAPRFGPLWTAVIITPFWALWHLPYFFLVEGYQSFDAFTLIGFIIGMLSGSIVLTWLYLGTGGSILAVAIWHTLFNMATATAAATGVIASSVSAMVIALALVITPRLRRQGNMVPAASTAPPSADQPKP